MNARRHHRGSVLVWVIGVMAAMIAMVGITIDFWFLHHVGNQLQFVADASALAAVANVQSDQDLARIDAVDLAAENPVLGVGYDLDSNEANADDGDVVFGRYDRDTRTFTPTTESPNAAKVVAHRTEAAAQGETPLLFGPIFGVSTAPLRRTAIAMTSAGGEGPAMVLLSPDDRDALNLDSNAEIHVEGSIYINSDHSRAMYVRSNARVFADDIDLVGDYLVRSNGEVNATINTDATALGDPFSDLVPPDPLAHTLRASSKTRYDGNQTATIQPGVYQRGISIDSNARVTMEPGVYIIEGGGIEINSNGSLIANGVMIYNTGGPGGAGSIRIDSNGDVVITPPSEGPWQGISIYQDRDVSDDMHINSNGRLEVTGTVYAPTAGVQVDSNGASDIFGGNMIVYTLEMDSNGRINVGDPDARPFGQGAVFLVE